MTRCQPRDRISPRDVVLVNTMNAVITAQYQRLGEINSPATIARLVATPTWIACRVLGRRPASIAASSGTSVELVSHIARLVRWIAAASRRGGESPLLPAKGSGTSATPS